MTIEEIVSQTAADVVSTITKSRKVRDTATYLKQYDPSEHDVHDTVKRPDKVIVKNDETTGEEVTYTQPVSRISVPFQQIIVDRAATFLVGEGISLFAETETETEDTLKGMVDHTWHDTKMDYKNRQLARIWMSETECAELWYFVEKPELWAGFGFGKESGKFAMRCRILARSLGDELYPHFDEYGDMDAFGHGYKVGDDSYFDLYTATEVINYKKQGDWKEIDRKPNLLSKIPVVYYERELPEWSAVQPMIDRYETMVSNLADNNDYFANPMIVVKGEVEGFASKGEQGKIITTSGDASVSYLTWDQAPQATVFEKTLLQEMIFAGTQTPDISFEKLQTIGNTSGIALKLMFMDAKLKTLKHQETFGEGVQRRVNLIKRGMGIINTAVEAAQSLLIIPEFEFYLPSNEQELVNMLVTSTGGKPILSQKTAVSIHPFVTNPVTEMEIIGEEEEGRFGNIFPEPEGV